LRLGISLVVFLQTGIDPSPNQFGGFESGLLREFANFLNLLWCHEDRCSMHDFSVSPKCIRCQLKSANLANYLPTNLSQLFPVADRVRRPKFYGASDGSPW